MKLESIDLNEETTSCGVKVTDNLLFTGDCYRAIKIKHVRCRRNT